MSDLFRTFKAWSWSQLDTWRSCPYKARLRYLERIPQPEPEPDSPLVRGIRVHKAAEDFILEGKPLAKELTHFKDLLTQIRELHRSGEATVEVEKKFYLDKNWRPCDKDNRWLLYIPDIKVSGPLNLTIDLKTGRKHGNELKHYAQTEMYSVGAWIEDGGYDTYEAELWYVDKKDITQHTFTAEHLEKARARLDTEVQVMMADKVHPPRPNRMTCKWCPYSPRGTGDCPVGV